MKTMHLFAGAGGGILADLILGHEPVCAVEIDGYCCAVLRERVTDGWFPGLHVWEGDVKLFDPSPWAGRVDQISAGFPCQDISVAGPGCGLSGKRSGLISEVWRAVDIVQPGLVFLENSPNIKTKGRDVIHNEFWKRGYTPHDGTLAASHVGAGHQRNRWWCLAANANGMRQLEQERRKLEQWGWFGNRDEKDAHSSVIGNIGRPNSPTGDIDNRTDSGRQESAGGYKNSTEDVADINKIGRIGRSRNKRQADRLYESQDGNNDPVDTLRDRLQIAVQLGWLQLSDAEAIQAVAGYTQAHNWSPPDAGIRGMVHGVSDWVHGNKGSRIKALGNGQVPLQAATAWTILMDWHLNSKK